MQSEPEMAYAGEPVSCICRNTCQRGKIGSRGACPCKSASQNCTNVCKCGTQKRKCRNKTQDSDSETTEDDSETERRPINTDTAPINTDTAVQQGNPRDDEIKKYIKDLPREQLENVTAELFRRQPAAYADFILQPAPPSPEPPSPEPPSSPQEDLPWCRCGQCRPMPTPNENKCCTRRRNTCITHTQLFDQLVLNAHVLEVAMNYRADMLAAEPNRNNDGFRHAAYRQYILWQHGRLGAGNRRIIPSCVVWAIRDRFPALFGVYTGFRPGRF